MCGCVSMNTKPIDASIASTMKGQTVAKATHKKPDFAARTAGKAAFAIVGAFAMISAGNEIVAKNNIDDPADSIASSLAQTLEANYSAHVVPTSVAVSSDDAEIIAATAKGAANLILDVKTVNWSFGFFPADWNHYRVIYTAKARLIDSQKKNVIAEGFCKHVPETNVNAPTYDELLANGAERLKKELSLAAEECVKNLKSNMLRL